MTKNKKDIRDIFFNCLYKKIKKNKKIILLTVDQGAFGLNKIRRDFPKNFYNIGISEQNIFNVSIGLYKAGYKPYVYLISPFILRAFEQIKIGLSSIKSKIIIIGSGYAFTYASDGPTHYFTEDYGVLRNLPNIDFYCASDPQSTSDIFNKSYKSSFASYIRLDKGLRNKYLNYDKSGVSHILKGKKTLFISSGYLTYKIINLLKNKKNKIGILDITQLIPLNISKVYEFVKNYSNIIFAEENSEQSSLGRDIYFQLTYRYKINPKKFKFINIPHDHFKLSGNRDYILKKTKIIQKIEKEM